MFTTFSMISDSQGPVDTASVNTTPTGRPKRRQVARACDSCRLNRIRCNDSQPCRNCQSRGSPCSNSRLKDAARMLPAAKSEIETLKSRVRELESELKKKTSQASPSLSFNSTSGLSSIPSLDDLQQRRRRWLSIWEKDPHTNRPQVYGPTSSTFLMQRMTSYLKETLQKPDFDDPFEPVTSLFATTASLSGSDFSDQRSSMSEPVFTGEDMSRSQEEHFLNLFWQSYHITVPILNEKDFREYYNSLWTNTFSPVEAKRKPSALVDSILALCVQYGTAFVVDDKADADIERDDVSFAGRGLYRRSQKLLSSEYEAPTISTVQCLIYSALYLSNTSMLDAGHQTLAVAIGIAHALGLHREAIDNSSAAQSSLRRRIWWTLFLLDSKNCLELGRPFLIDASDMTCDIPSGDASEATDSGSSLSLAFADINWLAFHTQCIKLIVTVRSIYTSFYEKCSEVSAAHNGTNLYDNLELVESCADHLLRSMKGLQDWVRNVPNALKVPRKGTGEPLSTTRSAIELDPYVPLWLQRQRLLLELLYHSLTMCLHRPFIGLPSNPTAAFQISVDHSVSCLSHAIVTTSILHQVLTEGDILNGWRQAYQSQWDATLSILGFGLAHPVSPHSPSARRAIHTAIANFDMLAANNCSIATSAGAVTRNLLDKIDLFASGFRHKLTSSDHSSPSFQPGRPSRKSSVNTPPVPQHLRASPHNQALQLAPSQVPYSWVQDRPATSDLTLTSSPSLGGPNDSSVPASSALTNFSLDMFGTLEETALLPYQDLGPSDLEMWSNWDHAAQKHNDASQMSWVNDDR